jgi:hypothetical protein
MVGTDTGCCQSKGGKEDNLPVPKKSKSHRHYYAPSVLMNWLLNWTACLRESPFYIRRLVSLSGLTYLQRPSRLN